MIIVKIIIRQMDFGRIIIRPYDDNAVDVFGQPIFGLRTVFGEYCTHIVLHFVEVGRSGQGDQASDQPDIFYGSKAVGSV